MSLYYRVTARLAKDGKNVVVERQLKIHDDQVGDHNWTTVDRFNTTSLEKVPSSKKWMEAIPPAQGICGDAECAEYNPHVHFMTDPRCINYGFDKPNAPSSGCHWCDEGRVVKIRYGKRQHFWTSNIDQDPQIWVDCENQQKLLPAGPFDFTFESLGVEKVALIAEKLCSNAKFILTAIIQSASKCECNTCKIARDIVREVVYPEPVEVE